MAMAARRPLLPSFSVPSQDEAIGGAAPPAHFLAMEDDDDDAHHPYHQLHHLYAEDLHVDEQENEEVEEDGEEDEEEEDGDEEDEDEDDGVDDDEEEDEDGDQEHQDYEQDYELEQRNNNPGGMSNLHSGSNGATSAALVLYHPDTNAYVAPKPDGAGDKHSVRDDWTEAATFALLGVWGDRYLQLNKGNLKQEDWEEVAETVSSMSKSHKTDVQCKNRLDTLKKKYKVEKHKQSAIGSSDSKWPFYKQLDKLLSATAKRAGIPGAVDAGLPVKSALDREGFNPPPKYKEHMKTPNNTSSSSKSKESPEMTFSSPHAPGTDGTQSSRKRKCMDTPFKTLAKAITKFGEIYEKMEQSKQQQLMDLEKIRMQFTRELEIQRMRLFMQTQVELAKMKHGTSDIDTTVSNLSG